MIVFSFGLDVLLAPSTIVKIPAARRPKNTISSILSLSPRKMYASTTVQRGERLLVTPMIVSGMYLLAKVFITCVKVLLSVLKVR